MLIILPTYNEKENLAEMVECILEVVPQTRILVVDDNSPDGTGLLADEIASRESRVKVLHREKKLGLGTAYLEGFRYALKKGEDFIFEMDCDFSHDPQALPKLLEAASENDLVIGSRYIKDGGVSGWGFGRQLISRWGSLYARLILNLPYRDLTGGFKCFRRKVLEAIDLESVQSNGYCFQIEMTFRAHKKGFKIAEVPIIFSERRLGQSKMSKAIVLEALLKVWKLRFSNL